MGTQRRKNIETIENDVADSDYLDMEQFISSSPWSHEALVDQRAREVDSIPGDAEDTGFILDETGFLKKGQASDGVQRQWSDRAGKIENCQVGVFCCLVKGERMCLTDFRLFLSESWPQDKERCDKAKIPEEHRAHRAKWQQALDITSGPIEAFNNQIARLVHRSCGIANLDYLFLKMRAQSIQRI